MFWAIFGAILGYLAIFFYYLLFISIYAIILSKTFKSQYLLPTFDSSLKKSDYFT